MLRSPAIVGGCKKLSAIFFSICCIAALFVHESTYGADVAPRAAPDAIQSTKTTFGVRRLTEEQYRNTIADIFDRDIAFSGRFDTIVRPDRQLLASGAGAAAISPAGFESFDSMARIIAGQVVDAAHRATYVPCTPADAKQSDATCAARFIGVMGDMLWRRPMTKSEVDEYTAMAASATASTKDFYSGIGLALSAMLVSPRFLYRIETAVPDPANNQELELTPYAIATRISYQLWNSTPDRVLLEAARRGDLNTDKGLRTQVERLVASPKFETGVRAFFTDMLDLEAFDNMSKDAVIFPTYTTQIGLDLREQLLQTITYNLVTLDGDYRDLFTTRKTLVTRPLGMLYDLPAKQGTWTVADLPAERAGFLSLAGFVAVHSHSARSSPTLRGKAIRELLFCQRVPPPPGNVDFTVVQDTTNSVYKTARERLNAHATDAVCKGCHKVTDPLGLSFEKFDGIGAFRKTENGAEINDSETFEGKPFKGPAELGVLISQSPTINKCLVSRALEYSLGRPLEKSDAPVLEQTLKNFEQANYRISALFKDIATNRDLYRRPLRPEDQRGSEKEVQTASTH